MPGHAASTLDSAPILTKADAKAAAASSLVWVKLAPPNKAPVKFPNPKAVAASPVEPAPWLRSQTAPMAVESSEASTALAAGVECLAGACCFGTDACTTTNEVQCNAAGGSFQNTGSACATVDCTPSTGACCIDGTCAQLEQAVCLSVSGTFGGAGVDCGSVVCEQPCPEDLDNNGAVDFNDILSLLAAWGPCGTCDEDIDENGTVDFADLLVILAAYGDC